MERPSKEEKLQYTNQSNPKKTFSRCRSFTDSTAMIITNPKNNSLQHRRSPPDHGFRAWKVRNNDLAVEEILRERREAIESGKLKGRRLFNSAEDTAEVAFGGWESEVTSIFSYDFDDHEKDNIENIENKEELCPGNNCHSGSCSPSFSASSSYVCDECMEKEIVAVEGEKIVFSEEDEDEKGRSSVKGVKGWFTAGLLSACVIGLISMWRLICSYGDGEDEVMFLVPT